MFIVVSGLDGCPGDVVLGVVPVVVWLVVEGVTGAGGCWNPAGCVGSSLGAG
jgi:hypothetical protein